ncbi:MAG: 16S rRNA (cytosine(967)-C(5))-methyltransferase RsmB [Pseudomonadota bacterium]
MTDSAPLFLVAARCLHDIVDRNKSLDVTLADNASRIQSEESARLRETVYGSCRFFCYLSSILDEVLHKPIKRRNRLIHHLIVVGMYHIEFMHTPDHAVVNSCVNAAKSKWAPWAGRLVNAALRGFIRNKTQLLERVREDSDRLSVPVDLFESIKSDWPDEAKAVLHASNQRPPMTLRVNQLRSSRSDYQIKLRSCGIDSQLTECSRLGITLETPCDVTNLPDFDNGMVSVQDESAQLSADLLDLEPDAIVLDGCAAPGGKTGLILESGVKLNQLVAADLELRIDLVDNTIRRLGFGDDPGITMVPTGLFEQHPVLQTEYFDRIILDVPCSGTGVMRRHPDIRHRRQPGDFAKFADQQVLLLQRAWPLLKPGGKLLYITCSIQRIENDGVISRFIKNMSEVEIEPLSLPDGAEPGVKTRHGHQRLPGIHHGDGFYFCRLRKPCTGKDGSA